MVKHLALFLLLALVLGFSSPAYSTVGTIPSQIIDISTGSSNSYAFPFIADSAYDIAVIYTDSSNVSTTLSPTQYSVSINPPVTGNLWGIGGIVTAPLTGSNYPAGTSVTIQRIIPLLQTTALSNQGNFYPQAVESALDVGVMQNQQIAARTGSYRGTWLIDTVYNYGDIVQDGPEGLNSLNYYMCTESYTSSGSWATDIASGYWVLIIQSTIPTTPLPLSISNGGTGESTAGAALNALGGIALSGNNDFTGSNTFNGANNFTGGSLQIPTRISGDSSSYAASTAFVNGTALTLANGTTAVTQDTNDNSTNVATTQLVANAIIPNITKYTSGSGTYTVPTNTLYLKVTLVGGGGGGAGAGSGGDSPEATTGGTSTFGTSLLTATGGIHGITNNAGGLGGTTTVSSPAVAITSVTGGSGGGAGDGTDVGGMGGSSCLGGAGGNGGSTVVAGLSASANTGSGGGGAAGGTFTGSGGGAGGCLVAIITSPSTSYSYAIGAGGTAGTNSADGGNGGNGSLTIEAY